MKKVYIITGIDCSNCAAKIEQKFAKVPGVERFPSPSPQSSCGSPPPTRTHSSRSF